MQRRNPIFIYLKTNLNLVLMLVSAVLVLNALIFGSGMTRVVLACGITLLYFVISAILFLSGRGAKEIVSEMEKERLTKVKEKIIHYKQLRDRISFLRIQDGEVRNATDYFLITIGNYLNKCSEVSSYSPQANARIEDVLETCQAYLERLDQASLEARYKTGEKEFLDYKERTINIIKDASAFIKDRTATELDGLTQEEKVEIIEDVNKDA
jgi:hypothetical protein